MPSLLLSPALAAAGIQTLHITGKGKAVKDDDGGLLAADGYRQVEYVDGMENVYAAADVSSPVPEPELSAK